MLSPGGVRSPTKTNEVSKKSVQPTQRKEVRRSQSEGYTVSSKKMGNGAKKFKQGALAVMAVARSGNRPGSKSVIRRQLSQDPSAMDVLSTFVDESLDNSPLSTLARNKCDIPDALLLEG
jgi:hypothetical protein